MEPPVEQRLRGAIDAHSRVLRRVVRRLGVPEFEVDDILQEAFITLVRKSDAVHAKAERAFLLQVAMRIVLVRQRGFMRRKEDLSAGFEEIDEGKASPEEQLSQQQSLAILDAMLAAMPLELRMVFNLCEIELLSVPEAAEILEVPTGTASSRLKRARETFAKLAARARARVQERP